MDSLVPQYPPVQAFQYLDLGVYLAEFIESTLADSHIRYSPNTSKRESSESEELRILLLLVDGFVNEGRKRSRLNGHKEITAAWLHDYLVRADE